MCIWERIFSKVVKLSTFRDFRADLFSVSLHKGLGTSYVPWGNGETSNHSEISKYLFLQWLLCKCGTESCWGIILDVGQEKERQLVRSLARDKSRYRNQSIFLISLSVSLKRQRIFPDAEKTALADMYKSLFYKQQLLLNNKIAKTESNIRKPAQGYIFYPKHNLTEFTK